MYSAPFLSKNLIEDPQVAIENGCETAFYFNTSLAQVDIFHLTFDFGWVPYPWLGYATPARFQIAVARSEDAVRWYHVTGRDWAVSLLWQNTMTVLEQIAAIHPDGIIIVQPS